MKTTMRSLSKREKNLVAIMGLVLSCFVFYKYVFTPQLEDFKRIQSKLGTSVQTLDMVKKTTADFQKELEASTKAASRLKVYKEFDPGNPGTDLLWLYHLADAKKITIKSFNMVVEKAQAASETPQTTNPANVLNDLKNLLGGQAGNQNDTKAQAQAQTQTQGQTQSQTRAGTGQSEVIPSQHVRLQVSGTYDHLTDFFSELEDSKYFTVAMVESVAIDTAAKAAQTRAASEEAAAETALITQAGASGTPTGGAIASSVPAPEASQPNLLTDPVQVTFTMKIYNMRDLESSVSIPIEKETLDQDLVVSILDTKNLPTAAGAGDSSLYTVVPRHAAPIQNFLFPAGAYQSFSLQNPKASIEIKTPRGDFKFPVSAVNLPELADELGTSVEKLQIMVGIFAADQKTKAAIQAEAEKRGARVVVEPVTFQAIAIGSGQKSTVIKDFVSDKTMSLNLAAGVNPDRVKGFMYDPIRGTLSEVPVTVEESQGNSKVVFQTWGSGVFTALE